LECAPDAAPTLIASLIEREGYAVRTCEGPTDDACDLLDRGACSLVDGADVVVNLLGDSPSERAVLGATERLRRPPAVVAQVGNASTLTRRALLDDIDRALEAQARTTSDARDAGSASGPATAEA
jgi:hypothetical protein